ncbi:MAG: hypothetical protein K8L99_22180 [Anaerolineae bacterium]|nr:hypothetical protein [Anaerolineae bacterium]
MQRRFALAPVRRCQGAAAPFSVVCHAERPHTRTFLRCALLLPMWAASDGFSPLTQKRKTSTGETTCITET